MQKIAMLAILTVLLVPLVLADNQGDHNLVSDSTPQSTWETYKTFVVTPGATQYVHLLKVGAAWSASMKAVCEPPDRASVCEVRRTFETAFTVQEDGGSESAERGLEAASATCRSYSPGLPCAYSYPFPVFSGTGSGCSDTALNHQINSVQDFGVGKSVTVRFKARSMTTYLSPSTATDLSSTGSGCIGDARIDYSFV